MSLAPRHQAKPTSPPWHMEPMVVADLELVNLFGSVEWPCILNALQRFFPEACAWTDWQHQRDSVTQLPAGSSWCTNRGAEQGGSVWHHLQRVSPGHRTCGVCDEWYIDDGQVPVRLVPLGLVASRPRHDRFLLWRDAWQPRAGHCEELSTPPVPTRAASHTACVRRTPQVFKRDDNTSALGAPFGSLDHINAQVRQAVESSSELRQAILRLCSPDSARMSPNLPTICASMETEWTTHCWPCFDSELRSAISASLTGDLRYHRWWQASTGVLFGCLNSLEAGLSPALSCAPSLSISAWLRVRPCACFSAPVTGAPRTPSFPSSPPFLPTLRLFFCGSCIKKSVAGHFLLMSLAPRHQAKPTSPP